MALNFDAFLSIRLQLDKAFTDMRAFLAAVKKLESEIDRVSSKKTKQVEIAPTKVLADFGKADLSVENIEKIGKQFNEKLAQSILGNKASLNSALKGLRETFKSVQVGSTPEMQQATLLGIKGLDSMTVSSRELNKALNTLSLASINLNKNLGKSQSLQDFKNIAGAAADGAKRLSTVLQKLKDTGVTNATVLDRVNTMLQRYVAIQNAAGQGVAKATAQIKNLNQALRQQNLESDEFTNRLDIAVFKLIRYRIAFLVLHGAILQIKDTVKVFAEVDHAIAQISKVLPQVGTNINTIRNEAFRMGKTFGVSITEVLSGMSTWAQLGFNQIQILKATEAALLGVNTTGLSNSQITDAMTAAIFSYGVKVENVTGIIDKWMAVQAQFAVTGADLANALFKVGSAAEDFGLTIDQLNGIITAIGTVTRATGSEVGNAFKTILSRLPQEDTVKAFQTIGVAVFKSENQFRNFFDVLGDVAKKWPELTDAERADIAQRAAGVRQYSKFIALMNDFSLAQQAVLVSQNSVGASFAANIIETQTLTKSWASLVVQADELKFAIGQDLAKPISVLIDVLKSLASSSGVGVFLKLASGIIATGTAFITFYGTVVAVKFVLRQLAKEGLFVASREMAVFVKSMATAGVATRGLAVGIFNLKQAITGLLTTFSGWLFLISTAIGIFTVFGDKVEKFSDTFHPLQQSQEEFTKSIAESVVAQNEYLNTIIKVASERSKDIAKLGTLTKGTDAYNKTLRNLTEGQEGLTSISKQASAAVDQFTKGTIGEREALDQLNTSVLAVVASKEKQLTKDRALLEVQLQRLRESAGQKELEAAANIKVLNSALSIAIPEIKGFANSLELLQINTGKIKSLQDLKDVISLLNNSLGGLKSTGDNLNLTGIKVLIEGAVKDLTGFSLDKGRIEKFREEFFKIVDIPDEELKERLNKRLTTVKLLFENFSKGISTIPTTTESDKNNFVNTFLNRLDLLQQQAGPILEILKSEIQDSIEISGDEAKNLFKQIEAIEELLKKPKNGQEEHFVDFGKPSEETRNFVDKIIKLQKAIRDGQSNIESLVNVAFKSGGALKNLSSELARFYEQSAVDILNIGNELDTRLEVASKKAAELRAKIGAGGDKPNLDQFRKELDIEEANIKLLIQRKALTGELKGLLDEILNRAKAYNGIISISNDRVAAITAEVENYARLTKEITTLLSQSGIKQEDVLAKEKERFNVSVQLRKKQLESVDVTEQEAFARRTAVELTEEQLDILKRITTLDLSRSISRLSDGIKSFRGDLSSAFSDIPDIINEGYTKRRELQNQIFEAEQELMQARRDGDRAALESAKNKLSELRDEASDYRSIWFEIKGIVDNLFSSVSTSAFNSISEKFAEDLANIQIGGASLGEQMGKSISGQFDVSVEGLISQYEIENTRLLDRWSEIHNQFLIDLAEVLGRPLPELGQQFGPETPDNIKFANAQFGPPTPDILDTKQTNENINKAFRSGSILAGQIISNYIGRSGSEFGQTVAGFLQTVVPTLAPSVFAAGPQGAAALAGLGIVTGLIGSLFKEKEKPQKDLIRSIDRNSSQLEANTITMKEFSRNIFNAPPNFNFTGPSGSVPVGGNSGGISVTVNVANANTSANEIAQTVVDTLNRQYRINQGSIGGRGTRIL